MANVISKQIIFNGDRRYIIKYNVQGDSSGELTNSLILGTTGDIGLKPKLVRVQGACSGACKLVWDATTKVDVLTVPITNDIDMDFSAFGGLPNNAGSGSTGDLLITTTGLASTSMSLVLTFIK